MEKNRVSKTLPEERSHSRRAFLKGAAVAAASVALVGCSSNNVSSTAASTKAAPIPSSAYGNEDAFVSAMGNDFFVQQGKFEYLDVVDLASRGKLVSCFGNNAGSGYFSPMLPPAPNQDPAKGVPNGFYDWPDEKPSSLYDPKQKTKPENPYFSPVGWSYKLRQDEAIVIMGQLPPTCTYYSFINYLFASSMKNARTYTEQTFFQFGNERSGKYLTIFASMGQPANMLNIKHTGDTAFDGMFVIVACGDENIFAQVKEQLVKNGFDGSLITEAPFPAACINMGLETTSDTLNMIMRVSQPEDEKAYAEWRDAVSDRIHAYRITPKNERTAPDQQKPYGMQQLHERGTGQHELASVPNANSALDEIRANLIKKYGDKYEYQDLLAHIAVPEGMTGYLNAENAQGDNRDASYLMTDDFKLNSDDDFIVIYGVNHAKTGKCLYANTVLYGRPMLNGIVSVYDSSYAGSADAFLAKETANRDAFYTVKMARTELDEYTKAIPYSTGNSKGKYFGADKGSTLLLAYRAYLEPSTGVGPSYYEIVYDRALVFHKK